MMLDDFFTLTEINNGLTVPSRVRELVTVMQKDRDSVVKNVGEATRQWSAVATAIAATEDQDCLDLFLQLDGLQFFSNWLKDAQKFSNDSNDSFLEDSIVHLLQALGKLHVAYEKLVASEIWTTVKDLLAHNSSKVKDKAQWLFESWKKRDRDGSLSDVEKFGALTDDVGKMEKFGALESFQKDDSSSKETSCKELGHETTGEDPMLSASSDAVHPGQMESTQNSDKVSDPSVGDDAPSGHAGSPSLSKPSVELPLCHSSVESCNPANSREDTLDVQMEFHELESHSNIEDTRKTESPPDKSGSIEEFNTSEDRTIPASSDAGDATKSLAESSSQKLYVAGNKSSSEEDSLCNDSRKSEIDGKCSMDDRGSADEYKNSNSFTTGEGGAYREFCKSFSIGKSWKNTQEFGGLRSGTEDHGKINTFDLHVSADRLANDYEFAKKEARGESDRAHKKSDVDLYGIIDPLEVARQVAMEVEREIVGYREQSCSSSEKLPESNEQKPGSPDSVSGKRSHASEDSPKDVPDEPDLLAQSSPMQEESATSTANLDYEQINGTQDMETSQVTEAAQEEANTERGLCNFDLNLEVCSEEADRSANQFMGSVSLVSASRAAAAPVLPVAPLQFEGNLGWKGSAATSAFRPASPRKLPGSEKFFSVGESSSNSKPQGFLDIDLNVAEITDGRTVDVSPNKNVSLYTGFPSVESSVETNLRRSEHLNLDLNLASEDDAGPSDWRMRQFFPQGNGQQNVSHSSSSSSSSKQHFFKNIDLNGQPSFVNDSSDNSYLNKSSQGFNIYGGVKSDDSAISIMGTRVEVKRKDVVSPFPALPNGRTPELAFDVNLGRTGNFLGMGSVLPYGHSSVYGYNNIAQGPAMPFSSTLYGSGGPFHYMMDSRGAPVIPQMTGFSQTPFFINMAGPTNGVGTVVPTQGSFDPNSGIMLEGGSREAGGFFLNSGRVRSMDEQLRSNAQPTISSVVTGKRKEPEIGWEQYPLRHGTPPWK